MGERTDFFLRAKKAIRQFPDASDEEIAEKAAIPAAVAAEIIREARKDVAAGGNPPQPGSRRHAPTAI